VNKRGSYLATSAIVMAAMSQVSPAMAQSAPTQPVPVDQSDRSPLANRPADKPVNPDDIVVTGSRLRNPTLTSPSPLQVIDQQAIKREAFINVQDAIQLNPTFGNPGNSRTTSNGSRTGTGISSIGLRNGGPNLTLVLIDGRRVVPALPGSSAVDVGFIPTGFIDRVEILTGGASAVYGSDAIAGVVNFIYKKHYEGIQANFQSGISGQGDDPEYSADVTLGRNFADGKGNALFYVGWSKQGFVSSANRDYTAGGYTSLGTTLRKATRDDNNLNAAKNLFVPVGIFGNTTPAGLFTAGGKNYTVDPNGTGRLINPTSDIYNGAPYGAIASPLERLTMASRINYQLTPGINLFAQGTYGKTKTTAYSNPLGLVSGGGLGVFGNGGVYDIESFVTSPGGVTTKVRNPFVPDAIYNAAVDSNKDGLKDISFSKRMADYGNFRSDTDRDQFQVTIGAEGDLGKKWRYEAYYSYGQTTANQVSTGLVNADRFAQALTVIPDINDVNNNGNRTEAICADPVARATGCVPANIFGTGQLTPDAIAYTQANILRYAKQTLQDAAVNLNGPLFKLFPAGSIQVAIGAEYRRESSQESFDPLAQAGRNGFAQQTNTRGAVDVKEAYGEIQVPILAKTPFFESLMIRGAARASKYSQLTRTFFGYNGGFEWAPVKDIRFRGVYAHAIRAPGISELFRPAQVTIDTVTDPCLGVTATSSDRTSLACRRDPAVVANINANGGVFTLNNNDKGASVTTLTTPNPNLREQSASTITLGAVINPTSIHALRNLTITADYYKLSIKNGIGGVNISSAADLCYNQGQQSFCDEISRRSVAVGPYSVGSIEQYLGQLSNGGTRLIEGIDVSLSYLTSLSNVGIDGNLSVSASYSHLLRSYTTPMLGGARRNLKGELGTPSDPATVSMSYDSDRFGVTLTGQYLSPYFFDQPFRANYLMADGTPVDKKYFRIPPYIYTNVQFRLKAGKQYEWFFGIKNLTDTRPPGLWSGLPGTGYVFDPIGRRFYAGLRLNL
jgi:iron complex outermembrane recepter protein